LDTSDIDANATIKIIKNKLCEPLYKYFYKKFAVSLRKSTGKESTSYSISKQNG